MCVRSHYLAGKKKNPVLTRIELCTCTRAARGFAWSVLKRNFSIMQYMPRITNAWGVHNKCTRRPKTFFHPPPYGDLFALLHAPPEQPSQALRATSTFSLFAPLSKPYPDKRANRVTVVITICHKSQHEKVTPWKWCLLSPRGSPSGTGRDDVMCLLFSGARSAYLYITALCALNYVLTECQLWLMGLRIYFSSHLPSRQIDRPLSVWCLAVRRRKTRARRFLARWSNNSPLG